MSYETQAAVKDKNYAKAHASQAPLPFRRAAPKGEIIELEGIEYMAYPLEEYKKLGNLIVDYYALWDMSLSLKIESQSLLGEIEIWRLRCHLWEKVTEEQLARADALSTTLDKEHKLRLTVEKRQRALGWLPWALVVVESVAIGFLGIYSASVSQ